MLLLKFLVCAKRTLQSNSGSGAAIDLKALHVIVLIVMSMSHSIEIFSSICNKTSVSSCIRCCFRTLQAMITRTNNTPNTCTHPPYGHPIATASPVQASNDNMPNNKQIVRQHPPEPSAASRHTGTQQMLVRLQDVTVTSLQDPVATATQSHLSIMAPASCFVSFESKTLRLHISE